MIGIAILSGCAAAPAREAAFPQKSVTQPQPPADPGVSEAPSEPLPPDDVDPEGTESSARPSPYKINLESIVRIVYAKSPRVIAAREEMIAAQHGLEEFRSNLSRFEPFAETRSDLADFPNRNGAFGSTMEAVLGVQKETFEGATMRVESGAGYSNFRFQDLTDDHEEGSGALVRGRLEKPFFGSRRRQNRVIAQAFQESTARKAQLEYLDAYRDYVDNALGYYNQYLYYDRLLGVYGRYVDDLELLVGNPGLKPSDLGRVESEKLTAETEQDKYRSSRRRVLTYLLAELGLNIDAEYEMEPSPPYELSEYAVQARDPDQLEGLIVSARANNPTFKVLRDAIANSELQRRQALEGRYDVTTFVEGTLFPVGSETFDDRLDGWLVGGGLTVRLNDHRVLTATRLKAEAEIRQFKARIETEELFMRRRIITETQGILDNHDNRNKLLEARRRQVEVFAQRREEYFANTVNVNQLLESRSAISGTEQNLADILYSTRGRERRLMSATGKIFDMVNLRIDGE